jgi:hypothetical protein
MATTIDADLAGKIISANALEAFTKKLAPLQAFTTSFDSDAGQVGEKIVIPYIPEFANDGTSTVSAFTAGTTSYDADKDTKISEATINLDSHLFTNWKLNDTQVSENSVAQLERFGQQKGADLANTIFVSICSTILNDPFSTSEEVPASASSLSLDDIIGARKAMVTNGGDPAQCSLILNSDYFAGLLSLTELTADAYGSSDAIRGGKVPSILGIPAVYETPQLPDNDERLVGLLVHPAAIGVAFRYLQPNSGGEAAYTRTDRLSNDDGMTMGYRQFYKATTGESFAVLEALYGYVTINPKACVRLVTPAE